MSSPETTQALLDDYGPTEEEQTYFAFFEGSDQVPPDATTPAEAQSELIRSGYDDSTWEELIMRRLGSHYLRACGIIALGNEPRLSNILANNIRAVDYLEGRTVRDILVNSALDYPDRHTIALQNAIQKG